MTSIFTIRPATLALNDGDRVLNYIDSQLPWLAQHGAEAQWGITTFSNDEKSRAKYKAKVQRSEIAGQPWKPGWMKVYVAETDASFARVPFGIAEHASGISEDAKAMRLPVAAMVLSGSSADYTRSVITA